MYISGVAGEDVSSLWVRLVRLDGQPGTAMYTVHGDQGDSWIQVVLSIEGEVQPFQVTSSTV